MQRPGRGLQRSASKRGLDPAGGDDDDDHAAKRPRVPALGRCVRVNVFSFCSVIHW
jgi:hypothetical protein